tara:strand:+ start:143 stop:913 length:771 start_codon:yes stop_codon:yes gene_type:complete
MKSFVTILGCGSSLGVPWSNGYWGKCNPKNSKNIRTRCSILITKGNNNILIDTTPDLRFQLIKNKVSNISYVLYSHQHGDQTHGINDLRSFFIKNKKHVNIFGNNETLNYLKNNFTYLFKGNDYYPQILKANLIKKKFSLTYKNSKINFKTIEVAHGKVKSVGYIFNKTAYISDCSKIEKSQFKFLKNLKYLIIDCLRFKPHYTHLCYDDVIKIIKILLPKKTILTNLHTDMDYNYLLKKVPSHVKPAYDNMKLYL